MATPFSEIYEIFLSNVDSYSLFTLLEEDASAFEEECKNWLLQAVVANPLSYKSTLDFDLSIGEFKTNLDITDKVIMAKHMVIEYLNPFVMSEVNLKQSLNSKDYRSYSPSKHLESLIKIKKEMQYEVSVLITRRSYTVENLKERIGKKK